MEGNTITALANFCEVTLASVGNFIRLSIDWRTDRVYALPQYDEYYVCYGMYGSNGTVVNADGQASTTENDLGYYVMQQLDAYMSWKSELPAGNPILGSTPTDWLAYGMTGLGNLGDATLHTTELLLTRVEGGLEGKVYYDDVAKRLGILLGI